MNNASGLGFAGYDEKDHNEARWDLLTNVKPFHLEMGTSLKTIIDSWNIRTNDFLIDRGNYLCFLSFRNGSLASTSLLRSIEEWTNSRCFRSFSYLGKIR